MAVIDSKWTTPDIVRLNPSSQTADFNAENGFIYFVNPTLATLNITLPVPSAGSHFIFKDMSGGAGDTKTINILRNATENIDGVAANIVLDSPYQAIMLYSDGTDWYRI